MLVDTEGERGATDRTEPPSPDPSWIELVHLLQQSPGWTTTRMLTGQILDVRLAVLRRLAEEATELLAQRELTKRSALRLGGHLRALHLELGGRLVDRRLLEHREDVDHLSVDELRGRASMPSRAEVAWRRRWLEDPHATMPLPIRFRGVPSVEQPAGVAEAGDRWVGWAASGGRCTGRAVVLDRPSASGLERGDVLVARNTDASWMPIFSRAGAVVIEEGGPLSHAAIVARELGLPAVLNLPGIVARLSGASSTWVTVDGDAGTVELVDGGARDAT